MPETVLIPINDLASWLARGHAYPKTTDQFRTLYRNRQRNGLGQAFVRIGTRILVDEAKFLAAAREQSAGAA